LELVGNADKVVPEQIGVTAVKAGMTLLFTAIVKVVLVAHNPGVGVKVYKVVAVLFNAGNHVPTTPFKEVVGNEANRSPEQIVGTGENAGVTFGVIIVVSV
jgi:hypothetical protein